MTDGQLADAVFQAVNGCIFNSSRNPKDFCKDCPISEICGAILTGDDSVIEKVKKIVDN